MIHQKPAVGRYNIQQLQLLADTLKSRTGIFYPFSRLEELGLKVQPALQSLGIDVSGEVIDLTPLLNEPWPDSVLQALIAGLTVRETQFFRAKGMWKYLEEELSKTVLALRGSDMKPYRIWSTACCTGEEPYSISILLDGLAKKFQRPINGAFEIIATDISEDYLERAAAGVYSKWSLRSCESQLVARNFTKLDSAQFAINSHLKDTVKFRLFNLKETDFDTEPIMQRKFDLIVCRNVLIYFHQADAAEVLKILVERLNPDGELIVSTFDTWNCHIPGTRINRYSDFIVISQAPEPSLATSAHKNKSGVSTDLDKPPLSQSIKANQAKLNAEVRKLVKLGNREEALCLLERMVTTEPLSPSLFYFKAGLLIESNNHEAALESLEQAITINPRYTIAYFALYSLCRKLSRPVAAQAYLDIVRNLLLVCPATDLLEDGEGLTVGQLLVILQTLERVGQ